MWKKTLSAIITFHATAAAMEAELRFQEQGIPGRMIPVPREITAGCGLAWKAAPEHKELLEKAMTQLQIPYAGIHLIEI